MTAYGRFATHAIQVLQEMLEMLRDHEDNCQYSAVASLMWLLLYQILLSVVLWYVQVLQEMLDMSQNRVKTPQHMHAYGFSGVLPAYFFQIFFSSN